MREIYLDYNASTPLAPEVVAAMEPLLRVGFGNPSSGHWAGRPARDAVEQARGEVADLLGCHPDEVVFTSGGSEANNLALKGRWFAREPDRDQVITTAVEHPAVLAPCLWLEGQGARLTVLPVDGTGRLDPDDLRRALTPRTVVVSVMHAQNEVGTLQPLPELAAVCREAGACLHVDAAQSVGKVPTRVDDLGADLLTVAGHKLYAPKGIGALYLRRGTALAPLIHGAGHEGGRRAGTESALLAVGLGAACALAARDPVEARVGALRDRLWAGLTARFGDRVVRNGHPRACLPNTLHVSFLDWAGPDLLARLPGVAASTGSACHAGAIHASPALAAMGVSGARAAGAVRFSLGRPTTADEVDAVLALLAAV